MIAAARASQTFVHPAESAPVDRGDERLRERGAGRNRTHRISHTERDGSAM